LRFGQVGWMNDAPRRISSPARWLGLRFSNFPADILSD
jgi:hypothetical protein